MIALPRLQNRNRALLLLALGGWVLLAAPVTPLEPFYISQRVLKTAEAKYGQDAVSRLLRWQDLIRQDASPGDREKLEKVNAFFNGMIRFVNDVDLYGVKDYWATPYELIARAAGDCEDFAIAKFFTLKALGVAEDRLNITYVKALQYNIHHMVLTYYSHPGAEPLVLDNLIDTIAPASRRKDLMPIFSFNGTGLWLAKERGRGKLTGSSSRLKAWEGLQDRMAGNEL